jgi:hypothetical protein
MGNKTNIAHIFCAQSTSCSVVRGKALLFWLLILYAEGSSRNDLSPDCLRLANTRSALALMA